MRRSRSRRRRRALGLRGAERRRCWEEGGRLLQNPDMIFGPPCRTDFGRRIIIKRRPHYRPASLPACSVVSSILPPVVAIAIAIAVAHGANGLQLPTF